MLKLIANLFLVFLGNVFKNRELRSKKKKIQNPKKQGISKKTALYGETYYPDFAIISELCK